MYYFECKYYRFIPLWLWSESGWSISSWNKRSRWCNIRLLWIHRSKWNTSGDALCGRFPRLSNCACTTTGARLSKRKIWKVYTQNLITYIWCDFSFNNIFFSWNFFFKQSIKFGRSIKEKGQTRWLEKLIFPNWLWNEEGGITSRCTTCETTRWKLYAGKSNLIGLFFFHSFHWLFYGAFSRHLLLMKNIIQAKELSKVSMMVATIRNKISIQVWFLLFFQIRFIQ